MIRNAHVVMRAGGQLCALEATRVEEVMRPLPYTPLPADEPGVLGVAVVRGRPCPVFALADLIGRPRGVPTRWVVARAEARWVALAVDEVFGVHRLPEDAGQRWIIDGRRIDGFTRWGEDVVLLLRSLVEAPAA